MQWIAIAFLPLLLVWLMIEIGWGGGDPRKGGR